jgi:hypothetical protein
MKIEQITVADIRTIGPMLEPLVAIAPNLIFVFGAPAFFSSNALATELRQRFPDAIVIGCSTAGEVSMRGVDDDSAVITAVSLKDARLRSGSTDLANMMDSREAGKRLAESVRMPDLSAVLVFGQGININGSALVEGMTEILGAGIPITGGLAGDNGAFAKTWTLGAEGVSDRAIVAVGIAGEGIRVGHGSFGGWEPFGPARKITRCIDNVLYELDGEPALDVYKRYLGEYAEQLPASGLLFPFAMLGNDLSADGLIRTILGVDEDQGSVTLAGEIREGSYLKLMHASTDALVDGAEHAAVDAAAMNAGQGQRLALLISCVGRKLVMGDRTDEEIEAVASVLGRDTIRTGFYSYGEISPFAKGVSCQLHNQTMTITTIADS